MRHKIILFLAILPCLLFGHRVNIFATVEGNKIYTQSYSSDGSKVKGGLIEVYDKKGNRLLTGKTDSSGEFSFVIPNKDELRIVLTGGMGHRAETTVEAGDLPEVETVPAEKKHTERKPIQIETRTIDTLFLRKTIEEILDTRLHPIIKMLAEQEKERGRVSFTEVVGGIGYIFGIIGVVMLFWRRKKDV